MKQVCTLLICFLTQFTSFAQADNFKTRILTKEQMLEDFNFLRRVLQETHPALYRYTPKEVMQKKLDSLAGTLTRDMAFYDFYFTIVSLISDIRCAHTSATPTGNFGAWVQKQIRILPLEIHLIGDRMYAAATGTKDSSILSGYEILSINGRTPAMITKQIFDRLWADGFIESSRIAMITGLRFGVFYYMLVEQPDSFHLSVRDLQKKVREVTIPALSFDAISSQAYSNPVNKRIISLYKSRNEKERKKGWRLEIMKDPGVAYLRINGFGGGKNGEEAVEKMRKFMDKTIATLKKKKIQHLIFDLRNNGGGWDIHGVELFTYLMKDTTPVRYYRRKHTITDSSEFIKYSDLSPEDRANVKKELIPEADGTFTLKEEYTDDLKLQYPKPNRFTGNIYFLINGGTGSSASEFVAVAHSHRLGVFIGEESGGAYEGDNGGSFLHFDLPNSKIAVGTPLVYYHNGVNVPLQKGRGVIPDYPVSATIEDILNARDGQLEKALELIRKRK
jgi:hypothetical protein